MNNEGILDWFLLSFFLIVLIGGVGKVCPSCFGDMTLNFKEVDISGLYKVFRDLN